MASIITFPSGLAYKSFQPTFTRNSVGMRSGWTGKRQSLVLPYALWSFKAVVSILDDATAGAIRAFLVQLDGTANRFRFPIPGTATLLSGYTGAAGLVNGGSQTGSTLVTDGWSNSTLVLSPGDYFSVNDELKVVTAAATTNGSGQVTISFKPALRTSPADNAALTIVSPTALVSMNDSDSSWMVKPPYFHDFTFDCTEDF